ncbi:MAG TPA: alpha-2-macroglobulin family protein, partial [Chryseosolibacter sp.]|nr:alpha-2-macroglobulin family protein [Chryseosolibacter sp.]
DGGSQEIEFTMPSYIGSVKTMVVAGYEGAYGKTEKVSAVRKPLMVLATLPRVLGPEELVTLPVTLFTGEKNLQKVNIEVRTKGPVSIRGENVKTLSLAGKSDVTVDFELAVNPETGVASVEVIASSGSFKSTDVIEIQVRNPNLPVTKVQESLLEKKKTWTAAITPTGISGTNSALLEISSLPPINLGSRMRYLLQYPHGCIEQTTSSVFPQLYVDKVKVLTEPEREVIDRNVKAGIERIKSFVQSDGGFGYWPGMSESSDSWGTSYAGHFLVEAEAKGYYVPNDLIMRWRTYQINKAREWRRNETYWNSDLVQGYRLYTLAIAGAPELGAMNRLREEKNLSPAAAWMLASAFAVAGQLEAAEKLIKDLPLSVKAYRELGYTYGSALRDKALILETLVLLNDKTRGFEILKEISTALGDQGYWMSTQESAMCLRAVGMYAGRQKQGDMNFTYKIGNEKAVNATTGLPFAQVQIPITGVKENRVEIINNGEGVLFTRLLISGTPARGDEQAEAKELTLKVQYTDARGNAIDPSRLEQGSEFIAQVTVSHPGVRGLYENLALSQVFPSGWEINNLRLEGTEQLVETSGFRYQDIRDDRVLTYFNLAPREEKTFRVLITAAYAGDYYLPSVSCEAMYDGSIYARTKGQVVSVVKPVTQ